VPEDRFADLGPRRPEREDEAEATGQSAAERLAELDETDPELVERPKPPPSARPSGRYTWVVGIAFVIAIIVAGANALRHSGQGYKGITAGHALPVFAAPLATSSFNKDVNLQRKASRGVPAACDVREAGVVNLCDLRRRPLVITFVANASGGCAGQLDRVEGIRRSFPSVNFLGVISKRSLGDARGIVRSHRWGFPIALDRNADLFNLYAIGDCPTTVFAHAGGVSAGTRTRDLSDARLRRYVAALARTPRGALPP